VAEFRKYTGKMKTEGGSCDETIGKKGGLFADGDD